MKAKILVLNGDDLEMSLEVKDKFIFILTDDGRTYHLDTGDGNIWQARPDLKNLGFAHQEVVKSNISPLAANL